LVVAMRLPSPTEMVIVEVPLPVVAGVMTTVRLAPLPPNTMFASGTSTVFDELPASAKLPGGVSASAMVNAIGEVGVPSFVD
jgi:hypothetical protein